MAVYSAFGMIYMDARSSWSRRRLRQQQAPFVARQVYNDDITAHVCIPLMNSALEIACMPWPGPDIRDFSETYNLNYVNAQIIQWIKNPDKRG